MTKNNNRGDFMYCKNCGKQIDDNATICPNCGTQTNGSPKTQGNDKVSMIVVLILTIVVALSPFINMYYVDFFEKKSFSLSSILETTSEILDFGNRVGADFHLSDIRIDQMSDGTKLVFFIIMFDFAMFFIGFIEVVEEVIYLISTKETATGKFWRAAISSTIALFFANLIVFFAIFVINAVVNNEFGNSRNSVKVMGVNNIQYFFQFIAIVTYIIAHAKYGVWKKSQKISNNNS